MIMDVHNWKGDKYPAKGYKIGYRKDTTRHRNFFAVNIFSDTQCDRLFSILSHKVKANIYIKPL